MARYVNSLTAAKIISEYANIPLHESVDIMVEVSSEDVAPVRHGHIIWKRRRRGGFRHAKCLHRFCNFVIEDNAPCKHIAKIDERYTTDEPYCSECGKLLGDFLNYCGNCGARMDGVLNE